MRSLYDVPAPAKLNLFLHITGRRADGYHLLQSAFMLIDWCDTLHFERRAGGAITLQVGQGDKAYEKVVRLTRAHLEEDAGKSLHEDFHGKSGIDLNRAGTPLLEIVSEPDMRSSDEAVAYAKALHALVRWIGICTATCRKAPSAATRTFRCAPRARRNSVPAAKSRT